MKRIVLTGGGTAGHVTPNIALLPQLLANDFDVHYIGSVEGIERKIVEDFQIPYYAVSTGKLRRYMDIKNFTDPFRVMKGYFQARKILKILNPDIVFSKGGFVSVPVVRAAHSLGIPCIIHESDMTPGLANKLCMNSATKVCCNFPETMKLLPQEKAVLSGSPIREELKQGNKAEALSLCGFDDSKPIIMVIGGSLGAGAINQAIREALPKLLERFQIIHICGKEKVDNLLLGIPGYKQFDYVKGDLRHLFAAADIVISRAGANAICEILALQKPHILIPLSTKGSRGDQLLNAASFENLGYSMVINEDDLIDSLLVEKAVELYENQEKYITAMKTCPQSDAIKIIIKLIKDTAKSDVN